jgi:hypothetical protein
MRKKIEYRFYVKWNKRTKRWQRVRGAYRVPKAMRKMLNKRHKVGKQMNKLMLKDKKYKKLSKTLKAAKRNLSV